MTEFLVVTLAIKTSIYIQADQARWLVLLLSCEHDNLIYTRFSWKSFQIYLKCFFK